MFSVPGGPKIIIFCSWSTKIQYFLSQEHQKSIFSVPGTPKINILEHQKSILSVRKPEINISFSQSTTNQYLLTPDHQNQPKIIIFFCLWKTKHQYGLSLTTKKTKKAIERTTKMAGATAPSTAYPWPTLTS